jgi:PAS domain S-box-containing protein
VSSPAAAPRPGEPENPTSGPGGTLAPAARDGSGGSALETAFRGLFESAPIGLLIVDDGGRIVVANRVLAAMLGHEPGTLEGEPLDMLLPERYRYGHAALMAAYHVEGRPRMMGRGRDLTAVHADGKEVPVEIGLSRIRWLERMMTLAVVNDIGARKRLELELRQANSNLQEFTYVASHDLVSPLRGVADLLKWIGEDLGDPAPPKVVHNLQRAGTRIDRMQRLIDDLLRYARASRASTDYSQVDLTEMITDILEMQPLPEGFEIEQALAIEPFQATRTPLMTVLRNLLSNAVKHHDRGNGRIRIEARAEGDLCAFGVTDDGPGVPPAAGERVFRLFQTLTAAERGGTGIGLALSKRLVEVHGGRIELVSPVRDGRGASFRFWWPRFPVRVNDETDGGGTR